MTRILLACGWLSSLLYVATDLIGALSYPGYDYASQAISEMSAVGAPTARLIAPFYLLYAFLFLAFGVGVWTWARVNRRLRLSGGLIVAVGALGIVAWPFFPMHMRGAERTFADTIHLALGAIDILLLAGAIALAAGALGRRFGLYSWLSLALMLAFGLLTSFYVQRVDSGLPTPGLGIIERIGLAAYLIWIAALSIRLLGAERSAPDEIMQSGETSASSGSPVRHV
jgi:hypothetical protein